MPQAWVFGLLGGLMIGIAAAVMLLGLGRIAGVSGLAARAVGLADAGPPHALAIAFIIGLPVGAWLMAGAIGGVSLSVPKLATLVVGGLLVGFGTRLGSGCTSGHGVCGMSRFSRRSILATVIFMASGIATVACMRVAGL
ncbi:MAG: YeeE/YedE thiosulfate transporter family protein [Acidocella sp.]|nr:YeeE/YedE thiosulfate transporter family protein [Acidocella sp.]